MHHTEWLKFMVLYLLDGAMLSGVALCAYLIIRMAAWLPGRATSLEFEFFEHTALRVPFAAKGPLALARVCYRYSWGGQEYTGRNCYRFGLLPSSEPEGRALIRSIQAQLAAKKTFPIYICPSTPSLAVIMRGAPPTMGVVLGLVLLFVNLAIAGLSAAYWHALTARWHTLLMAFVVGAGLGLIVVIVLDRVFCRAARVA